MSDRSTRRLLAPVLAAMALLASGCAGGEPAADRPGNGLSGADAGSAAAMDESRTIHVRLTTSMGDIVLEMDRERAPVSVKNFLRYVDRGFYDGTVFHRVMHGYIIQGGGFTDQMEQKPTDAPIVNEWRNGLSNVRGTIAMARYTGQPDSATSQFFINVSENTGLDEPQRDGAAYAVFGRVVEGMDVVDAICAVQTGPRDRMRNVPLEPVEIVRARRHGS